MTYTLATDGDSLEQWATAAFLGTEFPAYQSFWLKHVVPLTNRPANIQLKDDAALATAGKGPEDLAIAQLHYTVLKHLAAAYDIRQAGTPDDRALLFGLSSLVGAHDVAFELLQRFTQSGRYHPWMESRPRGRRGGMKSGQDAQSDWKAANGYPLQRIRDYRNKLVHGRTPPAIGDSTGKRLLPAMGVVEKYCDWRTVTAPGAASRIPPGDFETPSSLLDQAWRETLQYVEENWRRYLLP